MATGVNVSKVNVYAVLVPDAGVAVSKASVYAVLGARVDLDVSKVVVYALLLPSGGSGGGNRAYVFGTGWRYHSNHG